MTIAEVSKKYELSTDTLRYYERVGLIPPVPRTKSGIRDYNEESCGWVGFAKCMRDAGIPVEVLAKYVALVKEGDRTKADRIAILKEQRDLLARRIADMQETLKRLDHKIENYNSTMADAEHKLGESAI